MADVSIPINHARVHPLNNTENSKRGPKKIISLIVMLIFFLNIAALILILSGLIKLDATKKAFWAEFISQLLNGLFALVLLATSHTRIIPLVTIIQLLFLKSNDTDITCYIDNQKLLKKYVIWYDERYDSLLYLLLIHVLWMFNIFSQTFLAFLSWTFSSYDQNGNIVFPMLTLNPRPMELVTFCIIIAITSAIIAGILTGYKSYKKKQLQKLEKFITVT